MNVSVLAVPIVVDRCDHAVDRGFVGSRGAPGRALEKPREFILGNGSSTVFIQERKDLPDLSDLKAPKIGKMSARRVVVRCRGASVACAFYLAHQFDPGLGATGA